VVPPVNLSAGHALRVRVLREQRRAIDHVRRELARLETAMRWRTRQPDGPEVDIDAVVEREASIRAGHEGPDRLYVSRRRRGHDLAVLVLLDASMSTDGWVRDRRVLDTERDAAVVLSLALEGWVDELGLAAFMSYSHDDCRFLALKGFTETANSGFARLATLEPGGYTRVGPALRHGTELLGRCAARRRLLLLLTDGKPTDTDRYEGRHGERDVRQAIREARRSGVDVFAFAVDPRARKQLPAMFGDKNFAGLESPAKLASAATELCARLRS
jgi:nitric oxide reductase NorD protein